jgi:hypothetical protein
MFRLPFDGLRANGTGIEIVVLYPFVVSLSNHSNDFFSSLLDGQWYIEIAGSSFRCMQQALSVSKSP